MQLIFPDPRAASACSALPRIRQPADACSHGLVLQGHWTRIAEQVAGGLTYKPPRGDMNAPDLYIPLMACLSYILLGAVEAGLRHK